MLDVLTAAGVPAGPLSTAESISLLQALAAVPDPRKRRGRRHSLQSILFLALSAVLAGARSHGDRRLGRGRGAAGACLHRSAAPAGAAGGPVAEHRLVLAADGKTLRGARGSDGQQSKVFGVYDHACQLVLTQTCVLDGDEIAAFTTALATLREVVLTADALHCQRKHARWLHDRGRHYLFTVKANQPTLRQALAGLPWGQVPGSRRRQIGHGRTESRSIKVINLDGCSAAALFPHARRAIKVARRRRDHSTGKTSIEVVYAVTSLTYRQADPVPGSRRIWPSRPTPLPCAGPSGGPRPIAPTPGC